MSTDSSAPAPQLPERPRRRRATVIAGAVALVVIVGAVIGIAVGVNSGSPSAEPTDTTLPARTVTIGVTDESQPHWTTFSALAKKQLNVTVKLVNFGDYSQPNPALSQKQTDLNEFQHLLYLAEYNVTTGSDLQPIASTAIYPLPLYSLKYTKVSQLPDDAPVAIPNDAINQARGLLVLQSAGLLKLKGGGTAFSTIDDITSSKVKVTAVDASQTAGAVQNGSVAAAIVNKNYAIDAGLATDRAIAQDDPKSDSALPYVNAFVARKADADNPLYRKLGLIYQQSAVKDEVQKENGGAAVFQNLTAAKLQSVLARVEKDAKAAKASQ